MPRGDGTGPNGLGSKTGRGLGYCSGYPHPGYAVGPGRGLGRGFGMGRGMGWQNRGFGGRRYANFPQYGAPAVPISYPAPVPMYPMSQPDKLNMLKQEKDYLESEMNGIKNALEDISKRIQEMEIE